MPPIYTLCAKNTRAAQGIARSEVLVTAIEIALWSRFNSSRGKGPCVSLWPWFWRCDAVDDETCLEPGPSVERHAHPFFLAPDDVTWPLQLLALNDRRETIRNEKRGYDFQRGPGLRKVANRAINRTAAERDGSGFQDAMARSSSMLIHRGTKGGIWVTRMSRPSVNASADDSGIYPAHERGRPPRRQRTIRRCVSALSEIRVR